MLHNGLVDGFFAAIFQKWRPMRAFFTLVVLMGMTMHSSCAHNGSRRLLKAQEADTILSKAQSLYSQGEYEAAIAVLQNGIETMQRHDLHTEPCELLITWLLQLNRQQEALQLVHTLSAYDKNGRLSERLMNLINDNHQIATLEDDRSLRDFENESEQASPVWSLEHE